MKKGTKITIILLICAAILFISFLNIQKLNNEKLEKNSDKYKQFFKYYYKAHIEFDSANMDSKIGNLNYNLWLFFYDDGEYLNSIEFCKTARENFVSANNKHGRSVVYFEEAFKISPDNYKEIIEISIKAQEVKIDINWAMYEACEYFESGSYYFNKVIIEDDGFYETGVESMKKGNEKITLHDSMIKEYNKYITRVNFLDKDEI